MDLFKKLGSVAFAVWISVILMVVLIISTSMESLHGTTFAQKFFYHTKWFDFYLSLLWINILCATILRFPLKKNHIGFFITHVGILILLLGALITRIFAVEGSLMLFENESAGSFRQSGYILKSIYPDGNIVGFDLARADYELPMTGGAFSPKDQICHLGEAKSPKTVKASQIMQLSVVEIFENARRELTASEGQKQDPANDAIEVELRSPKLALNQKQWLIEYHPSQDDTHQAQVSGLQLKLKKEEIKSVPADGPKLRILDKEGKELAVVDLSETLPKEVPLTDKSLVVKNLAYYPKAGVVGNKIANVEDMPSVNPAVEFDAVNTKGESEHYVHFLFFPDFESIHGKDHRFDLTIDLQAPYDHNDIHADIGPALTFLQPNQNGSELKFKFRQEDVIKEGTVVKGTWVTLDWMDVEFRVNQILTHAHGDQKIVAAPSGNLFAKIQLKDDSQKFEEWLEADQPREFHTKKGEIRLAILSKEHPLPFNLTLKDFRKIDYPGTRNPSSFESDVALKDESAKLEIHKMISMNQPLDYRGYRIFQSSYVQHPQYGEASVFTIAKNPGIGLIYIGSTLMILGSIFQFYIRPLLNGRLAKDHNYEV